MQTTTEFYRSLIEILHQCDMSSQMLEQQLRMSDRNLNTGGITQRNFIDIIRNIDRTRRIGDDMLAQQAGKFAKGNGEVDYARFMRRLEYEMAFVETVDYVFCTIKPAL